MIKRYKLILITALAAVAALCLVAGCKLSTSLDDVVNQYNLECRMTYFLNEGQFEDEGHVKEMYYTANTRPLNISTDGLASMGGSGSAQIAAESRRGYKFLGWYEVETNSDGLPLYKDGTVYDEETGFDVTKGIKVKDNLYDFSKPLQKGDHTYACAKWEKLSSLQVLLICEDFDKIEVKDNDGNVTATYENGDVIREYPLDIAVQAPGSSVFSAKGYSFVSFYKDKNATERFNDWPVKVPETVQEIQIYAKYITGDWKIVENSSGIAEIFSNGFNNYYFLPEVTEIDCAELSAVNALSLFEGEIRGNDCTVKNLKVAGTVGNGGKASLFGDIGSNAKISGLTFENLDVTFTVNRSPASVNIYLICNTMANGATFTDFTVGGTITIRLPNDKSDDKYLCYLEDYGNNHWLYGGFETDGACNANINITEGTTFKIDDIIGQHYEGSTLVYETQNRETFTFSNN